MRKTIFDKGYNRNNKLETKQDTYIRESKINTRENFKKNILEGFKNCKNPTIKLIGSIQDNNYKNDMVCFAFELEKILEGNNINIELYITKEINYYNKIAIKLDNSNIKVMITGSSNITTTSLWGNNNFYYSKDIDIIAWDKYKLEENILSEIRNIENSLVELNSNYIDKIKAFNLASEENIKIINKNNYLISPLEIYKLSDKILEDINSSYFIKLYVKQYKLDLLKGIYYYYLDFYKKRRKNSDDDKEKYNCLKKNLKDYTASIKHTEILYTLKIIEDNIVIKNLLFETNKGNTSFYQLLLDILSYSDKEIKKIFIRSNSQSFINYYNEMYEHKL